AAGKWAFSTRGIDNGGWRVFGCVIERWETQRPRTSIWNTTDKSWATYSIRERAGRRPASPALPFSPPLLRRPTRFRRRSTSAASISLAATARPIPVLERSCCRKEREPSRSLSDLRRTSSPWIKIRIMNKCTAFFLIFLRLAIGWHFLAEGYHKLEGYWRGPTETVVGKAKPFSSAGYFREGTGPVAKLIRQQVGDPDSEALGRLEALPKSGDSASVPPHMRTPPLLAREWSDYVKRFGDYYGLDDKQRQEAEGKLQQTEDAVVLWLTKEDVDEKTKAIKKTFQSNTVEVKLPMPQRIAEYKAKLTDLRDTMNNRLYLMGHDVEGRRLLETKADTARLRSALLADLDDYTKELQKSLETLPTEEQKEQAAKKDT